MKTYDEFINPSDEAKLLANKYNKLNLKQKDQFLEHVLKIGGRWDVITRSTCFYPTFEKEVGKRFDCLWK